MRVSYVVGFSDAARIAAVAGERQAGWLLKPFLCVVGISSVGGATHVGGKGQAGEAGSLRAHIRRRDSCRDLRCGARAGAQAPGRRPHRLGEAAGAAARRRDQPVQHPSVC